ncbi:MAG TPA: gas vesicle protein [Methylomirabilota bacterium]|nr:gas vesicle protein [Methylomirabilota bacterium]
MKPRRAALSRPRAGLDTLLDGAGPSLLDLVDQVLNKGIVVDGEVVLGLAGVDLVYLRLSALLCAADGLRRAQRRRRPPRRARP